ncbi:MAG: exopolysaccharide biosynthesis polyprenyl glycosylphosphotransferase [Nitrospirota bacterium]
MRNGTAYVKKAVILAAGHETKLAPLTKYYPPWMFPVLSKPLINYTLDFLKKNGFEDILITLPKGEKIPDYLKQGRVSEINIQYYEEDKPRGTAGILKDIEKFLDKDPFLVIDSNLFIGHIDLNEFIKFHIETGAIITVGIYKENGNNGDEENVIINADKTVKGFHLIHSSMNKKSTRRPSGIYLFDPSVLGFIDQGKYMDIKEQLIPALQREAFNISAHEIKGFHLSLNNMNDYINLQRILLLNGKNTDRHTDFKNKEEIAKDVWIGKDVKVSSKAYLLGPIVIGDGCTIKDWAQIVGPAVIGDRCQISEEVIIRESILWDDVSLSNGSKIEYSVIAKNSNIPNNFHIKNMVVLNGLSIGDANLIPQNYNIKGIINLSDIMSVSGTTKNIYKILKRIMDVALSAIGVILLLPLFLVIAIAIKIDSRGSVFYIQKRCGIGGKLFNMIKFRSMVANAETLHEDLLSKNESDGPMFKITNDPRVTRLGKILRSTSLDEIPQLFNVIKGDMSLIGPRPLIMDEMRFSPSWRDIRLKVKPGITGLWQIQGRSEAPFHDWIKYDTYYVKNQSLWLDLKILFKTIWVVMKKVGAY